MMVLLKGHVEIICGMLRTRGAIRGLYGPSWGYVRPIYLDGLNFSRPMCG